MDWENVVYDPETREVLMEQADAQFDSFEGDIEALLATVNLPKPAYDDRFLMNKVVEA